MSDSWDRGRRDYAKPTKASMCSIVDHYANDADITRQDVDLLPLNPEETEVAREAMQSMKTEEKEKKEKKRQEKKEKKMQEKKEKERYGREDTHDHTQDHCKSADQLLKIKVKEEHKHRREERRRKREVAKKSIPEVDMQDKISADGNIKDVRRELAFLWYTKMGNPTRSEFKRNVAAVESMPIAPEDIDLLPWNLTGRVVNIDEMNAIIRASILKQ
jgi:hypothetical protein